MRHFLFVINPKAGRATEEEFEQTLQAELQKLPASDETIHVQRFVPESPEQMRFRLHEGLSREAVDAVGVVGGDGTIMEVLPVMVNFPQVPLALIPYGTGNLLAANLDIPRDIAGALKVLFDGQPRKIDLGKIDHHYFALLAGIGAVADIMEQTSSRHKKLLGIWAYLWDGLRTILFPKRSRFTITADGRTFRTRGVAVVISNAAGFMGPCLPLTPEAEPDDGLLDVCLIKTRSRRDYLPAILKVMQRPGVNTFDQNIDYFQVRRLLIDAKPTLKVQADGNIIGTTPVEIEIIRNRLQVMVPRKAFEKTNEALQRASEHTLNEILASYLPD